MKLKLAYLELIQYSECYGSCGHFYGKVRTLYGDDYKSVDVSKELSEEDCRVLNIVESQFKLSHIKYSVGDITHRFNTLDEIIEYASKIWRKEFSHTDLLVKGKLAYHEPQLVVAWKDEHKDIAQQINELYRENDSLYQQPLPEGRGLSSRGH